MGIEKVLSYGKKLSLSLLIASALTCTDKEVTEPEPEDVEGKIKQTIVNVYYKWAERSRQQNYNGMVELVVPGSSMAGATRVCKEQWDQGYELSYSFNSVEVDLLQESPPDAWVWGNWTMYQSTVQPQQGGFYSGAQPIDGDFYGDNWRLNEMNWDKEVNWWPQ